MGTEAVVAVRLSLCCLKLMQRDALVIETACSRPTTGRCASAMNSSAMIRQSAV